MGSALPKIVCLQLSVLSSTFILIERVTFIQNLEALVQTDANDYR